MIKDIASYVYDAGFVHAAWADTFLIVAGFPVFRLHALFASRSPVLYPYLVPQALPHRIELNIEDPNLTPVSVSMALATLYGHCLDLRSVDLPLAKGLIAAGSLLGLEAVATSGIKTILDSVSKESLAEILAFAFSRPSTTFPHKVDTSSSLDIDIFHPGPYPHYTKSLVQVLVNFILTNFNASENPLDPVLFGILLKIPFPILKHICESEKLIVSGNMGRHQFAFQIASARQQETKKAPRTDSGTTIFEENAVLSFQNGKGKVELIRRPAGKRKVLWKAGQN